MCLPHQLTTTMPEGRAGGCGRTKFSSARHCTSHSAYTFLGFLSQFLKHSTPPVFFEVSLRNLPSFQEILRTLAVHAAKR